MPSHSGHGKSVGIMSARHRIHRSSMGIAGTVQAILPNVVGKTVNAERSEASKPKRTRRQPEAWEFTEDQRPPEG